MACLDPRLNGRIGTNLGLRRCASVALGRRSLQARIAVVG